MEGSTVETNRRIFQARALTIVGAMAMVGGLLGFVLSLWLSPHKTAMIFNGDFIRLLGGTAPFFILPGVPGSGALALGAYLAQTRSRRFVYWAFAAMVLGLVVIISLAFFAGLGRLLAPGMLLFPIGWLMAVVGIALTIADLLNGRCGESEVELR